MPKCHEWSLRYHLDIRFSMQTSKKLGTHMSWIRHPMSFLCMDFLWKCQKRLGTQMSGIKHSMSFLYWFFREHVTKSSIPTCQELSIRYHFDMDSSIENVKKSSMPKCQELSIRCLLYMDCSMKMSKRLDTQMSWIKHPMSILYAFLHENVKRSSIHNCHELSIRYHFYMDFSMKMSKKARYPNVTNEASDIILIWILP